MSASVSPSLSASVSPSVSPSPSLSPSVSPSPSPTEYGIRVSKPKRDVKRCGLEDLSFVSNKNLFKFYDVGTWELELPGGWERNKLEIEHNLGYVPGFSVFGEVPWGGAGTYERYPMWFLTGAHINSTKLIISSISEDVITLHGYYMIYLDPLEE